MTPSGRPAGVESGIDTISSAAQLPEVQRAERCAGAGAPGSGVGGRERDNGTRVPNGDTQRRAVGLPVVTLQPQLCEENAQIRLCVFVILSIVFILRSLVEPGMPGNALGAVVAVASCVVIIKVALGCPRLPF
jgi:hypothetical protein